MSPLHRPGDPPIEKAALADGFSETKPHDQLTTITGEFKYQTLAPSCLPLPLYPRLKQLDVLERLTLITAADVSEKGQRRFAELTEQGYHLVLAWPDGVGIAIADRKMLAAPEVVWFLYNIARLDLEDRAAELMASGGTLQ